MIKLEKATYLGRNKKSFFFEGAVISETEYVSKVSEDWHYHVNHHISFILEGGNLEQRKPKDIQAVPGELLLYPEELLHRNRHTAHPSRNINLEVEQQLLDKCDLKFSLIDPMYTKFLLLKIYKECLFNDPNCSDNVLSIVHNIFKTTLNIEKATPAWAIKIRQILNDQWNENISLNQLSHLLEIHPVTISKHFPKYFNCTLGEYTRKLKINHAIRLIKKSRKSITEVAYDCGFFDQSHFIRTFKDVTGFTPSAYVKL